MKLYEIEQEILECLDMETGEIIDEERLDSLTMAKERKIENLCLWVKNLTAEAEALKAEKEAFSVRQKVAENKVKSLKKYLTNVLAGEKFETVKVKVSFIKSETLEISDGAVIPEEYLKYSDPIVDKMNLKKAIKGGLEVNGVSIVQNTNINIK